MDYISRPAKNLLRCVARMGMFDGISCYIRLRYGKKIHGLVTVEVPGFSGHIIRVPANKAMIGTFDEVYIGTTFDRFRVLPEGLIIDAGANIGLTSALLCGRFPNHQVVCLEPAPQNIRLLTENVREFTNAHILPFALYGESGSVTLDISSGNSLSHSIAMPNQKTKQKVVVRAVTMNEILTRFDTASIALFKIDIEGAEVELFSTNTHWVDSVQNFCIEFHDRKRPGSEEAITNLLKQRGFKVEKAGLNHCFYRTCVPS